MTKRRHKRSVAEVVRTEVQASAGAAEAVSAGQDAVAVEGSPEDAQGSPSAPESRCAVCGRALDGDAYRAQPEPLGLDSEQPEVGELCLSCLANLVARRLDRVAECREMVCLLLAQVVGSEPSVKALSVVVGHMTLARKMRESPAEAEAMLRSVQQHQVKP